MQFYPLLPAYTYINQPIDNVNNLLARIDRGIPDAIYCYELAVDWLKEQGQNSNNYRKFRSDLNIFLNWAWLVKGCSLDEINRVTMREFVDYGNTPPNELIAAGRVKQHLIDGNGEASFNPKWRPFVANNPEKAYIRKESSLKSSLSVLSSFYNFLIEMDYCESNPAHSLLNKLNSSNTRVAPVDDEREKALNDNQIVAVMETAKELARTDPGVHERTLFLVNLMIHCYPRISEVAARVGFSPTMANFRRVRNSDNFVFYVPRSKWSKSRSISCSSELIDALKRYRRYLKLPELPTSSEEHPLFIRHAPAQHGRDAGKTYSTLGIEQLSSIIKDLFDKASEYSTGLDEQERSELKQFSPHSLRHTGITLDVFRGRSLYDIASDSGHGDLNTLAIYISKRPEKRLLSAFDKQLPKEYQSFSKASARNEDL